MGDEQLVAYHQCELEDQEDADKHDREAECELDSGLAALRAAKTNSNGVLITAITR
jgi:hypothetical protein